MYQIITISMVGVGVLMVILGIVLSIVWDLPNLWSDVSGRSAERAISSLKNSNQGKRNEGLTTSDLYFSMSSGSLKGYEEVKRGETLEVVKNVPRRESDIKTGIMSNEDIRTGIIQDEEIATGLISISNRSYNNVISNNRVFTKEVSSLEDFNE